MEFWFLRIGIRNSLIKSLQNLQAELSQLQVAASNNGITKDLYAEKYSGCDSTKISHEISDCNTRLLNASQKLSDIQGKLEGALIQSGQFSDAVQSLLRWLEETKEIVYTQGMVSTPEPNVLKAQIMEQKVCIGFC